jgi:hypothetical protein
MHESRICTDLQETPTKPGITPTSRLAVTERESTTVFQLLSTIKFQYCEQRFNRWYNYGSLEEMNQNIAKDETLLHDLSTVLAGHAPGILARSLFN